MLSKNRTHRYSSGWLGDAPAIRVAMVTAFAGMLLVIAGTAFYCHQLLQDATAAGPVAETSLFVPLAAFLIVASFVIVIFQTSHTANRVAGPERRLAEALRQIRTGDLAFRVHLRRGDLLAPIADECNELLEWLNANPPAGAEVGSDVVSVDSAETTELDRNDTVLGVQP